MEQVGEKIKDRGKNEERKTEEAVKITVSKEAEQNLARVLERVNDGFDAGRINRQELASWALNQFAQGFDVDQIRTIRQEHFDEFAFLESILKKGRENGKLPAEIMNAMKAQFGAEFQVKRAPKRILTASYINDVTKENGEEPNAA